MNHESIAFIGDLTVDNYPEFDKNPYFGGSSMNNAIWALRAGAEHVSVIAAVGDDEAGKSFLEKIKQEHINSIGVIVKPGRTSTIEIIVDSRSGERSLREWQAGVLEQYHLGDKEFALLHVHSAASLTIYGKTRHLIYELSQWGQTEEERPFLAVNFSDLSHFNHSLDIVNTNIRGIDAGFFGLKKEDDAEIIKDIQLIARDTGKLMVVTLNEYGAVAFDGKKKLVAPSVYVEKINIQDKTGAGDAFLAGFIVEYMKSRDVREALGAGNRIAARKIQILGAY
jgi:sugar/nucleoside kinase (ribokinase family)